MKNNDVYKITNKVTGKVYIGITNQGAGARYRHHWYEARTGEPAPIHRSMAKYGEENFTLEIIDFAETYEELKEKEKYWIKQYDAMNREKGYNLTEGGDGTFGRLHSEETKEKIRQKALGRKASEETNAWGFREVGEFDEKGNMLRKFANASVAARAIDILPGSMRNTIRRKGKCYNGLSYRYLEKQ